VLVSNNSSADNLSNEPAGSAKDLPEQILSSRGRVLIVDRSSDNREVLRTMLQRHGVETFEAGRGDEGLHVAQQCHPNVMVIDLETVEFASPSVRDEFDAQAKTENTSIVLLGTVQARSLAMQSTEVVAKPYHYGPLIRKIEELLADDRLHPTTNLD